MAGQRLRGGASERAGSREAPFASALAHYQAGRLGAAEDCCRQALAADSSHADSLHLLGLILGEANKPDRAIDCVALAIRSDPNIARYFSTLGMLLERQGRLDEALKSYDLAIQRQPDDADVWVGLGDVLRKQRRIDEALLSYEHALILDAGHAKAANNAALLQAYRCVAGPRDGAG